METNNITRPVGLRSLPRRELVMTFAGVILAMLLSSLDQTIVGTAMPRIIADLGGFGHYTWVTTAYIISSAVTIPITGRLTDMYGRKFFYIAGLIFFLMASFACGLSCTMTQIVVFRGIQGIGAGIMMANAFTVIGDLFPPAERGKYQGLVSGVFGLSSIIGPTLGGFITDTLSWHWVFFINIPFGIVVILIFLFFFPHFRPSRSIMVFSWLCASGLTSACGLLPRAVSSCTGIIAFIAAGRPPAIPEAKRLFITDPITARPTEPPRERKKADDEVATPSRL